MAQKIKYQTTTIDATQSANEIGVLVGKYGARQFSLHWDEEGELRGVSFVLVDQRYGGIVPIRLGARTDSIYEILTASRSYSFDEKKVAQQANRIAWRQLRDLVEQLLLAAKTGLFSIVEAFMAHVVIETAEGAETMGEYFARTQPELGSQGLRLLKAGPE